MFPEFMIERVILVDNKDNEIGSAEKLKAHKENLLHRAFSVYLFNKYNELLLQQRAKTKYHSPNEWTNTCCGHPRPEELTLDAAKRRLFEEMGIKTDLEHLYERIYRVSFDNGLSEHEYLHVYFGKYGKKPELNKEEAKDYAYLSLDFILSDMEKNPEQYTKWFVLLLNDKKFLKEIHNYLKE